MMINKVIFLIVIGPSTTITHRQFETTIAGVNDRVKINQNKYALKHLNLE